MAKIIWSPAALEDVDAIAAFIARDSVDNAALFVGRLISTTDQLHEFPLSGRIIPEIGNDVCRELIYGSYRIMYRIERNEIWITGVVHGAMDRHPS